VDGSNLWQGVFCDNMTYYLRANVLSRKKVIMLFKMVKSNAFRILEDFDHMQKEVIKVNGGP